MIAWAAYAQKFKEQIKKRRLQYDTVGFFDSFGTGSGLNPTFRTSIVAFEIIC